MKFTLVFLIMVFNISHSSLADTISDDCSEYHIKLKSCASYRCYVRKDLGYERVKEILGMNNGKCSIRDTFAFEGAKFECQFPKDDLVKLSDFFKKTWDDNKHFSYSYKHEIKSFDEQYENILARALSEKICQYDRGSNKYGSSKPSGLSGSSDITCSIDNPKNKWRKAEKIDSYDIVSKVSYTKCEECSVHDDCMKGYYCQKNRCLLPEKIACPEPWKTELNRYRQGKIQTLLKNIDRKMDNGKLSCDYTFEDDQVRVVFKKPYICPKDIALRNSYQEKVESNEKFNLRKSGQRYIFDWEEEYTQTKLDFSAEEKSRSSDVSCLYKFSGKIIKRLPTREGPFYEDQVREDQENSKKYTRYLSQCKKISYVSTHPNAQNIPEGLKSKKEVIGPVDDKCHELQSIGSETKINCYYPKKVLKFYSKLGPLLEMSEGFSKEKKKKLGELLKEKEDEIKNTHCKVDVKKGSDQEKIMNAMSGIQIKFMKAMIKKAKEECKTGAEETCENLESVKKELKKECDSGKLATDKDACDEMKKELGIK